MIEFGIPHLLVLGVYFTVMIAALIAVYLYGKAYFEMKKTSVIRGVWLLLIAVLIDTTFFMTVTTSEYGIFSPNISEIMKIPCILIVPKILLIVALTYFIYASISPGDQKFRPKMMKEVSKAQRHMKQIVQHNGGNKK